MINMKIIDLSLPIKNNASEPISSRIKYVNYKRGGILLGLESCMVKGNTFKTLINYIFYFFGFGRITHKNFPNQMGLSWENLNTMTHRGTHVDAPSHFGPIVEGRRAKTNEELPLNWFYGDGVVINMRDKKAGELITCIDIKNYLKKIKYTLKPFDIVLINTGADRNWNSIKYLSDYPGLTVEAVKWILEKGVKVIGIDSYSLDLPSSKMREAFMKDKESKHLWPVHMLGRKIEYCHIEKLTNLDKIPVHFGFKVCCFPILIEKASAGWCRAVALL